jgi:hypothetical protein
MNTKNRVVTRERGTAARPWGRSLLELPTHGGTSTR